MKTIKSIIHLINANFSKFRRTSLHLKLHATLAVVQRNSVWHFSRRVVFATHGKGDQLEGALANLSDTDVDGTHPMQADLQKARAQATFVFFAPIFTRSLPAIRLERVLSVRHAERSTRQRNFEVY